MRTAFVLSGGGSLGAVQVGMVRALSERGVTPDLLVGTSAGALNAAYLAGHGIGRPALDHLVARWIETRRSDVFPIDPVRHVRALRGARPSLFADDGLRRLIDTQLTFSRLEHATTEVHLVATDLLSGDEVVLSEGDAASAVRASAAIPGMLPPVHRDGRSLVDGGLADNTAISVAVRHGADRVFVLPTGYACALVGPPAGALAVAVHSLSLLIQQRLIADVADFAKSVELHVLPPLCPLSVSSIDFSKARILIDRAYAASARWLDDGADVQPHPERVLSLHRHGRSRHRVPDSPRCGTDAAAESGVV